MLAEAAQCKWCWLAGWVVRLLKKALGRVQNIVLSWPPGASGITQLQIGLIFHVFFCFVFFCSTLRQENYAPGGCDSGIETIARRYRDTDGEVFENERC